MLRLRTHAIIFFAIFATIILLALGGNVAESLGAPRPSPPSLMLLKIVFLLLTLALGFAAIPLMVKFVVQRQIWAGNQDHPFIKNMIDHQNAIIWVIWGLIVAGLAVAAPAAFKDGLFNDRDGTGAAPTTEAAPDGLTLETHTARPGHDARRHDCKVHFETEGGKKTG